MIIQTHYIRFRNFALVGPFITMRKTFVLVKDLIKGTTDVQESCLTGGADTCRTTLIGHCKGNPCPLDFLCLEMRMAKGSLYFGLGLSIPSCVMVTTILFPFCLRLRDRDHHRLQLRAVTTAIAMPRPILPQTSRVLWNIKGTGPWLGRRQGAEE